MKHTVSDFLKMKGVSPIPMLTAYNYPVAQCLERAQLPILLVGDSVGMTEMGFASTREVTIEHMEYHLSAVRRGAPNTHVIGDLPFNTDTSPDIALLNAQRLVTAGADSVKLEGAKLDCISHLVRHGIAVVGHTGLTPQTAENFKQVGRTQDQAQKVLDEAIAIQDSGAFIVVLEHIPAHLAQSITASLSIPTIGIGAGPNCDGQVLVINDVLGLGDSWPRFSKQYAHFSQSIFEAGVGFSKQVTSGEFPPRKG